VFDAAAVKALGPEVAEDLSTHSFCIGLATRLKAMGFSNYCIRRFGRWATGGMVDVYALQFEDSFAAGYAALGCVTPGGLGGPAMPVAGPPPGGEERRRDSTRTPWTAHRRPLAAPAWRWSRHRTLARPDTAHAPGPSQRGRRPVPANEWAMGYAAVLRRRRGGSAGLP
jgi:hypothetical protein